MDITISDQLSKEVTIIQGDINAKVGQTRIGSHQAQIEGHYGIGERNTFENHQVIATGTRLTI